MVKAIDRETECILQLHRTYKCKAFPHFFYPRLQILLPQHPLNQLDDYSGLSDDCNDDGDTFAETAGTYGKATTSGYGRKSSWQPNLNVYACWLH